MGKHIDLKKWQLEDDPTSLEELANPCSLKDGLAREEEKDLRYLGCELIQLGSILLKLPQRAAVTGQILYQRFYHQRSFLQQNFEFAVMGCLLLASKLEESPRKCRDVMNVFYCMKQLHSHQGSFLDANKKFGHLPIDDNYASMKQNVIKAERHILKALGFVVHLGRPHSLIYAYLHYLTLGDNVDLLQKSWNYMNDIGRTDAFVRFRPAVIASACIHLGARTIHHPIPLPRSPLHWFELFNVSEEDVTAVCMILLQLYASSEQKFQANRWKCLESLRSRLRELRGKLSPSVMPKKPVSQKSVALRKPAIRTDPAISNGKINVHHEVATSAERSVEIKPSTQSVQSSFANEVVIAKKGISKIQFCKGISKRLLVASTWDNFVKLYDVSDLDNPTEVLTYLHKKSALCCTFMGSDKIASAGLDKEIVISDVETKNSALLGTHTDGIRCIEFSDMCGFLVSASNNVIKLWDRRTKAEVGHTECENKVYAMDVIGGRLIAGEKDRVVELFDFRRFEGSYDTRQSPLKYQTRAVKAVPSGDAFVLSSIGQFAVEHFATDSNIGQNNYSIDCHRIIDSGEEQAYPVNAIAFHPVHQTFATGGSDCMINMWDSLNRKRICQFRKFPTSVASLDFSADGNLLAIASSYLFEENLGPSPIPASKLILRKMSDLEVCPRKSYL